MLHDSVLNTACNGRPLALDAEFLHLKGLGWAFPASLP